MVPPVSGSATPVVDGNVIGSQRSERTAIPADAVGGTRDERGDGRRPVFKAQVRAAIAAELLAVQRLQPLCKRATMIIWLKMTEIIFLELSE